MPIHVLKVATIPGFPSFRVWPGTQDANGDGIKSLHAQGEGAIDKELMAELKNDVHIALQRAEASREELVQLESRHVAVEG